MCGAPLCADRRHRTTEGGGQHRTHAPTGRQKAAQGAAVARFGLPAISAPGNGHGRRTRQGKSMVWTTQGWLVPATQPATYDQERGVLSFPAG
ncbi:hypothetical protein AMK23_25790 [Streptomyces sp. CB02130]|nr:hypothetical protein AMK23_25790 [Streptomyces sp. CB02130]